MNLVGIGIMLYQAMTAPQCTNVELELELQRTRAELVETRAALYDCGLTDGVNQHESCRAHWQASRVTVCQLWERFIGVCPWK